MMATFAEFAARMRPVLHGDRAAVAAAHPLAVAAAQRILHAGGNAADAAVAAQAVLCVLLPNACGLGGDALLLVRKGKRVVGLNGSGESAAADGAWAADGGPAVTVPGAVAAWADLLEQFGSVGLASALVPAIELAEHGVPAEPSVVQAVASHRARLLRGGAGGWAWLAARPGDRVPQPAFARTLRSIAAEGPAAFYEGPLAGATAAAVGRDGGALRAADLAAHRTPIGSAITVGWHGSDTAVQPPMSQGVLLAMALAWLDGHHDELPSDPSHRDHILIELTAAVFAYRARVAEGAVLLAEPLAVELERASRRSGPRAYLHTAGVAVADADGLVVSSLCSVFDEFGAGTFVPEGGFVLNNRAAGFTDPPNDPAPGKRPVHTLAPAVVLSDDHALGLATPGADGQVQTLLQVLVARDVDGVDLASAVGRPRWRAEGRQVLVERSYAHRDSLRKRGHDVVVLDDGDERFGAVIAAGTGPTPYALGDWRRQVWAGVT